MECGTSTATETPTRSGRPLVQRSLIAVVLSPVVLVLSLVPDLALLSVDSEATLLGVVALMAMHVVTAGICVAVLTGRMG